MLRNFLVTALRNLGRHRLHSFINIGGLAVGLACAIFILLFLRDELSYDKWIPDSASLYRVETTINYLGRAPVPTSRAPMPVPAAMRDHIPGVTAMTRLVQEELTVAVGNRQFSEIADVSDPNFLQVVRLPLVEGNPATAFAQPESVVLSQSTAKKYFGETDPLGKTVTINSGPWGPCDPNSDTCVTTHSLVVTGVLKDIPHNTQLTANLILPNTSKADRVPQSIKDEWGTVVCRGYVTLAPGTDPQTVLARLKPIIDRSFDPRKQLGLNLRGSDFYQPRLTRFWDVHLTTDAYGGMTPAGSWDTIYGFAAILCLILLVACFNFTNLATARAALRAQEIALRKCVGAARWQLIAQFLGESLLTAFASLLVALALVEVLLPAYDSFLQRPITFSYLIDWRMLLMIVGITIAAGLLSGAYPAFVLSNFKPASVLRTNASGQSGSGLMRTSLVVGQFAVSIGLGIAAIVVFSQINFAKNIDLRFNRDGVLIFYAGDSMTVSERDSFAQALRANPGIAGVALSSFVPFGTGSNTASVHIPGDSQSSFVDVTYVSPEFPTLFDIKLLAGRLLSAGRGEDQFVPDGQGSNDGRDVLINAAAAHHFGLSPAQAVGKTIVFESNLPRIANTLRQQPNTPVRIVGVLDDAKTHGAREIPAPMVYIYRPEDDTTFSVRLGSGNLSGTLSYIDRTWRSFAPTKAIQPYFLDDNFNRLFQSDERQGTIFGIFVSITIFIACLGLFGLATFAAERRTKEIGIRKVFGAGTPDIVRLLLWQFSVPVLLANVVSWPIAYYFLHRWLESYAYRITLNPLYFLTAGAASLLIAWATVFGHTWRVARANSIHALRYE